jgi:hypothetical protein
VLPRFTYLFLDPKSRLLDTELRLSEISLRPRLFFFDQDLWDSTLKLKAQVGQDNGSAYAEALALFLVPARTLRVQQPIGWVRSCYLVVQRIVMGRRQDALVVYAFSISIALLVAS